MLPKAGDLLRIGNIYYITGLRDKERCFFRCSINLKTFNVDQKGCSIIHDFMIDDKVVRVIG